MTKEEAITREEAIRRIKAWNLDSDDMEVLSVAIPELAESEDERIRKELVLFLSDIKRISESGRTTWAVRKEDAMLCNAALAYLEKQKEQKPFPKFRIGDRMRTKQEALEGITDGMPVIISIDDTYYYCTNEKIPIAEQDKYEYPTVNIDLKPVEWSEEDERDERIRKIITDSVFYVYGAGAEYKDVLDYLDKLEKQKEQSFTHHEINESLRDAVTHQMEDDGDVDDFVRRGIDDIALRYATLGAKWQKEQKPIEQNTREQIVSKATTERQVVLISESNDHAEINWDTRSLEDTKALLECGLTFINKQLGIKSSEWSEKDKEMLIKVGQIVLKHWNSLSDSFYHKHDDENEDAESCYNWIKYLPDRFNLESKRERGEEACPNEAKQECSSIDISGSIKTSHIKTLENLLSYLKYERKTTQTEINTSFIPCLENLLKDAENTNGHVECIKFDNEFENQVSYLLASILNGEHEYSNGFIKYAAQSLLGQAKNELNLTKWSNATINGKPIPTENQSVDISLANWSEDIIRKAVKEVGLTQHQIDWFKTNVFPPKQEWNEEDERMLSRCVKSIESSKQFADSDTFKKAKDNEIDWLENRLKSLKPLPKQEWGEEDEKIRKALCEVFKGYPLYGLRRDDILSDIRIVDILDWLEKQKYNRMKPIYDARESFESALEKAWNDYHNGYENVDKLEDDYVENAHAKGFREGYLFGIEKQKEQKPAKWSEEDTKVLNDIVVFVSGYADKRVVSRWVEFLKSLRPKKNISYGELPLVSIDYMEGLDTDFEKQVGAVIASAMNREHQFTSKYIKWTAQQLMEYTKGKQNSEEEYVSYNKEWSEEEAKKAAEDYADEHPGMTHESDGSTIEDYDKPYNDFLSGVLWAKHQCQPKQELSIEKAIQWLKDTFFFQNNSSGRGEDYEISTYDFDSMEEMYESFRKSVIVESQPHWKPTKAQLNALSDVIDPCDDVDKYPLETLYFDLKKL